MNLTCIANTWQWTIKLRGRLNTWWDNLRIWTKIDLLELLIHAEINIVSIFPTFSVIYSTTVILYIKYHVSRICMVILYHCRIMYKYVPLTPLFFILYISTHSIIWWSTSSFWWKNISLTLSWYTSTFLFLSNHILPSKACFNTYI